MAVIDPTYLIWERNNFPPLSDQEFSTLAVFSQVMNRKKTMNFFNCTDTLVNRRLRSCKKKLRVSKDNELFFLFLQRSLRFDLFLPELTLDQANLLFLFTFFGTRSYIAKLVNLNRKEIYQALLIIKDKMDVEDLESLRLLFVMRLSLCCQ